METWTDRLGLEPSLVTASERALLGLKQTVEEVEGGQSFVIRSRTSAAVAIRILRPGLRHGSQVPECGACAPRPPQWPTDHNSVPGLSRAPRHATTRSHDQAHARPARRSVMAHPGVRIRALRFVDDSAACDHSISIWPVRLAKRAYSGGNMREGEKRRSIISRIEPVPPLNTSPLIAG